MCSRIRFVCVHYGLSLTATIPNHEISKFLEGQLPLLLELKVEFKVYSITISHNFRCFYDTLFRLYKIVLKDVV